VIESFHGKYDFETHSEGEGLGVNTRIRRFHREGSSGDKKRVSGIKQAR